MHTGSRPLDGWRCVRRIFEDAAHDPAHAPVAQGPVFAIEKHRVIKARARPPLEICACGSEGRLAHGHEALAAPLSPNAHQRPDKIHVADPQCAQFAHAHAGRVEEFKDGPVAQAQQAVALYLFQPRYHLTGGKEAGEAPIQFG